MNFKFRPKYKIEGNLITPRFPVHGRSKLFSTTAWTLVINILMLIVLFGLKFIK